MRIPITRSIKVVLLTWLKMGYIDTLQLPEIQTSSTQEFLELMKSVTSEESDNEIDNSDEHTNNLRYSS